MVQDVGTATTGRAAAGVPEGEAPVRLDVLVRSSVAAVAGHEDWRLVDTDTAFRDLGLTSLRLTELHERLREATGLPLPTGLVRSLTLVESAASSAARGSEAVDAYERAARRLVARPPADPDAFFRRLFALIDPTTRYPVPLPAELSRSARRLSPDTRWPWEAVVPVRELRAAPFPVLIVSGGARPVFERISDALAERLDARRLVVPGGHAVQNTGAPFNTALEGFWSTV
ncbi:hypothetical protein C3492_05220 [Streptomyces sp. Ru62]|nr:hypothetical protein C3492_05220 [Streptomyces sp. Ru62]